MCICLKNIVADGALMKVAYIIFMRSKSFLFLSLSLSFPFDVSFARLIRVSLISPAFHGLAGLKYISRFEFKKCEPEFDIKLAEMYETRLRRQT